MNANYYLELDDAGQAKYDALKQPIKELSKRNFADDEDFQALQQASKDALRDAMQSEENDISTRAKLEINNLVWMYASDKTTLHEAEEMASRWWIELMENRGKV